VDVKTAPKFEAGAPQALFDPLIPPSVRAGQNFCYDVAADGKRFLVNTLATDRAGPAPTPITVIVNWPAALKR
jgi:hypothetical protein